MFSNQPEYTALSEDARLRLESFYRRFCHGRLGVQYRLGHLVYACHAAFPLMLSPELANLIWINFKNYYYKDNNEPAQVHPIAVSDLLLSPLCREVGLHRYEVYPEIRSYLLMLLTDGNWFESYGIRKEGKSRLMELANFLEQYLVRKVPNSKYDGAAFRQLNDWAVKAWKKPQQLAAEVAKAFAGNTQNENEKGQLWLSLQMEKVGLQYERNVNSSEDKKDLNPFYRIYYYGKARKEELTDKATNTYEYAKEIPNYVDTGTLSNEIKIKLPLLKSAVERTERKVNDVQRVIGLFVGIENYQDGSMGNFIAPGNDTTDNMVTLLSDKFKSLTGAQKIEFEATVLLNEDATLQKIHSTLTDIYKRVHEEDVVVFFFSGRSVIHMNQNFLICYDTQSESIDTTAFSNINFNVILSRFGKKGQSVILLDVPNPEYYPWGNDDDIFITATSNSDPGTSHTSFAYYIIDIFTRLQHQVTYKHLIQCIKFQMSGSLHVATWLEPLLFTKRDNYLNYFFTRNRSLKPDWPLLLYNYDRSLWEVVPEDFKIWPANTPAMIYDYENKNLRPGMNARLVLNNEHNVLEMENVSSLTHERFYQAKPIRPALDCIIYVEKVDLAKPPLPQLLEDMEFGTYSNWGTLNIHPAVTEISAFLNEPFYAFILIRRLVTKEKGYEISFQQKLSGQPAAKTLFIRANDRYGIVEATHMLVRYLYLMNLALPGAGYVRYEKLNVTFKWYWTGKDGTLQDNYNGGSLYLSERFVSIEGGEIRWNTITVEISNLESFTVYYEIYLLVSDLTIKKVSPGMTNQVKQGQSVRVLIDEPALLDRMQMEDIDITIKVLSSRDPVQAGFEQTV